MSQPISTTSTSRRSSRIALNGKCGRDHLKKLSLSQENLRRQQNGTDIELICKDGSVHAHKLVLISSCDYFEAMFTIKMSEEASGTVNFTTTSRKAMEIILECLYTSRTTHEFTEDDTELLMEVLSTCHLMQLKDLLQAVWNTTTKCLNDENFCAVWKLGIKLDLITSENDPLIEFVINHSANLKYLEILDEKEMKSLVIFMIAKGETILPAAYILGWNWKGNRDEGAARLMENCDLKSFTNEQLSSVCSFALERKLKTDQSILFKEALSRL